ncbi:MAG: META domain-containing protein [Devosia sp.]
MAMAPAIIGSTWTAVEINGAPAPTQLSTFRVAEDNVTASGKGGCNSWSAPVSIDGGSIGIGTIRATNMACLGPGMKQEREYFATLGVTRSLEVADGELRFLDANGTIVIRFAV